MKAFIRQFKKISKEVEYSPKNNFIIENGLEISIVLEGDESISKTNILCRKIMNTPIMIENNTNCRKSILEMNVPVFVKMHDEEFYQIDWFLPLYSVCISEEEYISGPMTEIVKGRNTYGIKLNFSNAINNGGRIARKLAERDLGISFQDYLSKYYDLNSNPTEENIECYKRLNMFYKRFQFCYEKPNMQEKRPKVYLKSPLKGVLYKIDYPEDYILEVFNS